MDDDELYYLQPGFDLNILTIPRIRSILVAQNVAYPGSAKKGQLLEILEAEVLPKSKKLLRERDRVRRTSKGITDVPSQDGTVDGDDKELMPPPKTPRSRKSKSNLAESSATPATSRRSKTPRKSTSKPPRASDTETDDQPKTTVRKSRKSLAGADPVSVKRESHGSSPFSDENPFQSGSSPPPTSRRISSPSKSRKSNTGRRETSSPQIKQEDDHSKSTFRFSVGRLNSDEPEDGVYTTEEFTPAAARELAEDPTRPKRSSALVRRKKPTSAVAKATPVVILTSVLAALGGWYRQEKVNIGYCGVGDPNWSLSSNPHIPAWVHENLQPSCEACPQHAICFPDMKARCEDDFILQQHPLSLNGLVPLPPTCLPDSEKERRIKAVADRAVEELRDRRAAYECGEEVSSTEPEAETEVKTVVKSGETKLEIPEETLKREVGKLRRKGMTADEFEELWRGALGDIIGREEIEVVRDGSGRLLLSSSSLAKLPFSCAIRRWVLRTIAAYRIPLALLVILTSGAVYTRHRVLTYRQATAQIPALVATTLDRLTTQAALKEDGRVGEGFIAVGQLRDDVLRNVFSVRERERVWQNVRKVVEGNSNVRAASREGGKTGEWSRVWEWIGPVDLVPGLEGRRSGGIGSPADGGKQEMSVRNWDEGRPIY